MTNDARIRRKAHHEWWLVQVALPMGVLVLVFISGTFWHDCRHAAIASFGTPDIIFASGVLLFSSCAEIKRLAEIRRLLLGEELIDEAFEDRDERFWLVNLVLAIFAMILFGLMKGGFAVGGEQAMGLFNVMMNIGILVGSAIIGGVALGRTAEELT